jgi:hypothetical protein
MELAAQLRVGPFIATANIIRKVEAYFAARESVFVKRRKPVMAMGIGEMKNQKRDWRRSLRRLWMGL